MKKLKPKIRTYEINVPLCLFSADNKNDFLKFRVKNPKYYRIIAARTRTIEYGYIQIRYEVEKLQNLKSYYKTETMKKEIEYISKKIERIQKHIISLKRFCNSNKSEGMKAVLEYRENEIVMLNNIKNKLIESDDNTN